MTYLRDDREVKISFDGYVHIARQTGGYDRLYSISGAKTSVMPKRTVYFPRCTGLREKFEIGTENPTSDVTCPICKKTDESARRIRNSIYWKNKKRRRRRPKPRKIT